MDELNGYSRKEIQQTISDTDKWATHGPKAIAMILYNMMIKKGG